MTIAINSLTVDCHEPRAVARFWSSALEWPILVESEVSWVVMEDVEGNRFCVLKSLPEEGEA